MARWIYRSPLIAVACLVLPAMMSCTGYFHEDALRGTQPSLEGLSVEHQGPVFDRDIRLKFSSVENSPTHYCYFVDEEPNAESCVWRVHDFSSSLILTVELPHDRAGEQRVYVSVGRSPFGLADISAFRSAIVEVVAGSSRLLTTTLPDESFDHSTLYQPRNGELLLIGGTKGSSSFSRTLRLVPSYSNGGRAVGFSIENGPSLNQGRSAFGSFVAPGGKIIVFRGTSGGMIFLDSSETLEGSNPVSWTFLIGQYPSDPTSSVYTYYPVDNSSIGGSLLTITGTDARFHDLAGFGQVGPVGITPPDPLEKGTLHVIKKGVYAGQVVHLGGVGFQRVNAYIYDPAATWTTAAGVIPDFGRFDQLGVELQDGRILLVGGRKWDGSTMGAESLILFDPPTAGTIQASHFSLIPVGHQLIDATATLLPDGRVLIAGGMDFEHVWPGKGKSSVYIFDPRTNQLNQAAPLRVGRTKHSATLLPNGQVLMAGGVGPDGNPLRSLEVYDPEYFIQYRFRQIGELPSGRRSMSSLRLGDGRLVFGGGLAGASSNRELYLVDPTTETLTVAPGMIPTEVFGAPLFQPLRAPRGDAIFWLGRDREGGEVTSWSPNSQSFNSGTPVTALPELRDNFSATAMANGQWIVAGGSDGPTVTQCWNKAKIYRPSTNAWADSANNLTIGRCAHSAKIVPDGFAYGKILLTGGRPATGPPIAQSEIFRPGVNMFDSAALPSLVQARHVHGQWTLFDGRTLVFGGNIGGAKLATTEVSVGFRNGATFGAFAGGPAMVSGMSYPVSGQLPNGEYLVVGETDSPTGRCQIFNPFDFVFRDCSLDLPAEIGAPQQGFGFMTMESLGSRVVLTGGQSGSQQIQGVFVFE